MSKFILIISLLMVLFTEKIHAEKVELKIIDHLKTIEIKIQGKAYRAILDSGSNINAIHTDLVHELKDLRSAYLNDTLGGKTTRKGELEIAVGSRSYKGEFALYNTRVLDGCCDVILGRDFFQQNKVMVSNFDKVVSLNETPSWKDNIIKLKLDNGNEIVTSCYLNNVKKQCRIDLGSQNTIDVNGKSSSIFLSDSNLLSLEEVGQPGLSLLPVKFSFDGKNSFNIPAVLHTRDTGSLLYRSKVDINVGLFVLDKFDQYFNLAKNELHLKERSNEIIHPNPLLISLALINQKIVIKATAVAGCGSRLGLRSGHVLKKIDSSEVVSLSDAYALIDSIKKGSTIDVMDQDTLKIDSLKVTCKPKSYQREMYIQSPYGLRIVKRKRSQLEWNHLSKNSLVKARFWGIEANFSINDQFGIESDRLVLESVYPESKQVGSSVYFDGLKIIKNKISFDSSTVQLLALEKFKACSKLEKSFELLDMFENAILIKKKFKLCDKEMAYTIEYRFYNEELPKRNFSTSKFLYLKDQKSMVIPFWGKDIELDVYIDRGFNEEESSTIQKSVESFTAITKHKIRWHQWDRTEYDLWLKRGIHFLKLSSNESGYRYDSQKKFAFVANDFHPISGEMEKSVIAIRSSERLQYEDLIDKMIEPKRLKSSEEVQKSLDSFKKSKTTMLFQNVVLHELGHAFGLAHNFSFKTDSIMNYSNRIELNQYDIDAIRLNYHGQSISTEYELEERPLNFDSTAD